MNFHAMWYKGSGAKLTVAVKNKWTAGWWTKGVVLLRSTGACLPARRKEHAHSVFANEPAGIFDRAPSPVNFSDSNL
jgi:hypothetical protein